MRRTVALLILASLFALHASAGEIPIEVGNTILGGTPVEMTLEMPPNTVATDVSVTLDGKEVATRSVEGGTQTIRLDEVRWTAGQHTVTVATAQDRGEFSVKVLPGWLSIIPPLLAIGLALWFKEVLISLLLGVFSGALILNQWDPFAAVGRTTDHFIRNALADPDHASILIFTLFLGGMVGVITKSGGTLGVVQRVSSFATSLRRGQMATWGMGVFVFFDDYANTLIVGPTMRPITDRLRISREKLAYIVDSTAAPIASLVPISTWVGYEVGLIAAALASVGLELNPYSVFLETIPFRFYPLFALVMVFAVGYFGRDFGAMLKAERRALRGDGVLADGDTPLSDFSNPVLDPPEGLVPKARNAILPIATVLLVTLVGLFITGRVGVDPNLSGAARWREILGNADSYSALIWASFSGLLVATILSASQSKIGLRPTMDALIEGLKSMLMALTVLVLAWSLGAITSDLHTADFIVGVTDGVLSPFFVPVLVFVISAAIAFATGTSWATMAILIPLVVPVVHRLALSGGHGVDSSTYHTLLLGAISSVLAGSVWGDHCSPISDTTILSSMASGCDHIAHVKTQMPYALGVGFLGMLVGDIPTAFGLSPWVSLLVGTAVIVAGVRFLGKPVVEEHPAG
ncbi:MAG: Na+/H+ antiporter NhaC family protein [Thermoanaerobaculia bacterium]|nr:Na+/H+ antiporter NhaC family protein [Thermoanaerobaculia bacterium]